MRRMILVSLIALLGLALLAYGTSRPTAAQAGEVGEGVTDAIQTDGYANVVIALKEPPSAKAPVIVLPTLTSEIASVQDAVLSALAPSDLIVKHQYEAVPALAGRVTEAGLANLVADPNVLRIDLDIGGTASLATSVPLIDADDWHAHGITGENVVVAVLDTGLDTDHADLADDLIHQECFGDDDGAIDGAGFCPNGSDRQSGAGAAEDGEGHGTHVTGIITSKGTVSPVAVAPDADIVSIKVIDDSGSFFYFSEIVAALDFIINNRSDVQVINMSLGTYALFSGNCDDATAYNIAGAAAIDTLRANGVISFAASGNDGSGTQMSSPACIANVVSVGATDKSDNLWASTNRNATLDILAPGVNITSTGLANGTDTLSGTSMASPHAAGCAALFIEAGVATTPNQIEARLETSPVIVAGFPRIDCFEAVGGTVELLGQSESRTVTANSSRDHTAPLAAAAAAAVAVVAAGGWYVRRRWLQ
jgi:subtilisin family serine protease